MRAKLNLAGYVSSFGRACLRAPQTFAKAKLVKIGGSFLGEAPNAHGADEIHGSQYLERSVLVR